MGIMSEEEDGCYGTNLSLEVEVVREAQEYMHCMVKNENKCFSGQVLSL